MTKLLFQTHCFAPSMGGIEVHSEMLAKGLSERGFELKLVTQTAERDQGSRPYEVIRAPSSSELLRLTRWADLVYQNNIALGLLYPALILRKPYAISLHTWLTLADGHVRLIDRFKRWIVYHARASVAVSPAIREVCGSKQTEVIGNPYQDKRFKQLDSDPRQRPKKVVFLGRLVTDKGGEVLVRALSLIKEKTGNCPETTIIGVGPEKPNLAALAKKAGICSSIEFKGRMSGPELVRELNQHQVIAIPSVWAEPFGIVALEGIACGCVPIGTSAGGLPDAVGPCGPVVENGSVEQLANTLQQLLEDPNEQARYREQFSKHLAAHTVDHISDQYAEILNRAAKQT